MHATGGSNEIFLLLPCSYIVDLSHVILLKCECGCDDTMIPPLSSTHPILDRLLEIRTVNF